MIEIDPEFSLGIEDAVVQVKEAFSKGNNKGGDSAAYRRVIDLIKRVNELTVTSGINKWFSKESGFPIESLPKHKAFFDAGAEYSERLALAANRSGKSIMGCYETVVHALGDYPSWWAGRRFDTPVDIWVVGPDARTVRDTIQKELMGPIGEWGTGMIPASAIGKYSALQGTSGAIDVLAVKSKFGGWSRIGFKNYQQDLKSFMGTARHVVWCDEEVPIEIYNECNVRTATTNGIMICTFTPLEGLTPMVVNFCKKADYLLNAKPLFTPDEDGEQAVGKDTSKAILQIGWDDVPWLTPEVKKRLLDDTPEHMKEARSKGIPAMGAGNVYTTALENILCDPFSIPDSWPRMYALDVGWNRTACMWGALDPNTDTIYIYDEYYVGQELPIIHAHAIKSRGAWIPGVIDPAANGRGQYDGTQLMREYTDLGLDLINARNDVEAGITRQSMMMATGKLKVFKTCKNWASEYIIYRRDKNGKVVKENDHALDTSRYIVMNSDRMASSADANITGQYHYESRNYRI